MATDMDDGDDLLRCIGIINVAMAAEGFELVSLVKSEEEPNLYVTLGKKHYDS